MKNTCRLIIDPPAAGSWNMSVDQALMETADTYAQPTLRIYSWHPATLSLGYFQYYETRLAHKESLGCTCVRRSTGGGAILHDQEITYSLCLPSANRWSKKNTELYDLIHQATIETLRQWNIAAQLFPKIPEKTSAQKTKEKNQAFLCFERRTSGDVILDQFKIGGSAQRRSPNALLQHGSILLAKSTYAPQLPGIQDLSGKPIDRDELTEAWIQSVNRQLKFDLLPAQLSENEFESTKKIENERYVRKQWNEKR